MGTELIACGGGTVRYASGRLGRADYVLSSILHTAVRADRRSRCLSAHFFGPWIDSSCSAGPQEAFSGNKSGAVCRYRWVCASYRGVYKRPKVAIVRIQGLFFTKLGMSRLRRVMSKADCVSSLPGVLVNPFWKTDKCQRLRIRDGRLRSYTNLSLAICSPACLSMDG